jgi:hypothetical protein
VNWKVTWPAYLLRDPDGGYRGVRIGTVHRRSSRAVLLLLLAAGLVVAIDFLTAAVNGDGSLYDGTWSASVQRSHWADMVLAKKEMLVTSRDLKLTVAHGNLDVQAVVTTPAASSLAYEVALNEDRNSGDDFVKNVLGEVRVAEFRHGFTGLHHSWWPVSFYGPQLAVSGRTATITVKSLPFRLYMKDQYIFLGNAPGVSVGGKDQIHVTASSLQVSDTSGAVVNSVTGGDASLRRLGDSAGMTLSEGGAEAQGWLDGLRGIGGIEIPVAGQLLFLLGSFFYYILVLWSLAAVPREFPGGRAVVVAHKTALIIVTALAAVAFIGLALDLSTTLFHGSDKHDYVTAGPLALLLAGTAVLWPVACARVTSASPPGIGWPRPKSKRGRRAAYAYAVVPVLYLAILRWVYHISPLAGFRIPFGTALVAALVPCVVYQLLGHQGAIVWLASAGTLAVVAAATVTWPMLWYSGFLERDNLNHVLEHVNAAGKLTYVAAAVLVVAGLWILTAKAARALARPGDRWHWLWTAAVVIGIGAAVLPAAVITSQVDDVHANGLVPAQLFGLFDALPQLLDWVLLVVAIMVLVRLPATPDPRPAARRIAIPVGLVLLYWNGTWLYLPVTFLIGALALSRIALPKRLATAPLRHGTREGPLRNTLTGWRRADFASGQSQALAANSSDKLHEMVLSNQRAEYRHSLEGLENAQAELAKKRERGQRQARSAKTEAFGYKGCMPDRGAAKVGAQAGAVLGIIPALITLLITQPTASGDYPVLDFLGTTAWYFLGWVGLGWFIGYFLPLIRGDNGTEKALWLFVVSVVATLPISVMWDSGHDWRLDAISYLETFIFLMVVTVLVCDVRTLKEGRMRATDWVRVQNVRFVVTWSTAVIAAIATAGAAFLTTAATDLSHQAVNTFTTPTTQNTQNTQSTQSTQNTQNTQGNRG